MLLVTDPLYPAAGRRYGDEDVWLAGQLRESFAVASCSPLDAVTLMDGFDAVLVRNSGPVLHYAEAYAAFRGHAARTGARLVTDLGARADALGKQYLLDLTSAGAQVIPSIGRHADICLLPDAAELMVKPLLGSDSIGISIMPRDELPEDLAGCLVQPLVDIDHEISYVFVDHEFIYAVRSTDGVRWQL
ncbi:MAG: hypothetical protein JWN39_2364, partial [Ilumatobacteraceae bacterium]|nr:hypothetical protein [Ilumatobacteraceae bacterium]